MKSGKQHLEESFRNSVNSVFQSACLQLSEWLTNEKNVNVSAEELAVALDVPFKATGTPSVLSNSCATFMPNVPNYFSAAVPSPSKKRGGRVKKEVNENLPNCQYKMTRGKSKGQECPNKIASDGTPGSDKFCKACLKKAAVKEILEQTSEKTTLQPPSLPNNLGKPVKVEDDCKTAIPDELTVEQLPNHEGYFKECKYGFIVTQPQEGTIIVHKIDNKGTWRDLTDEERKIALNMGLQVAQTDPMPINVPGIPAVPQISNMKA